MSLLAKPSSKKTLVIICGPTAVGKTAVAIQVAKYFKTEIINADSRQIYKELNIGVAKPKESELAQIKHHLIGSHTVKELFGAGDFEKEALILLSTLFDKRDVVIMCGGTGMYIKALCEGLDELPKADEIYRKQLQEKFALEGIAYLQNELKIVDENAISSIDIDNPQRLMRALEIIKVSGKRYSEILEGKKKIRSFNIVKVGLNMEREKLYALINKRVDEMIEQGLLEEARELASYENYNALKTVGYNELFDYFKNKLNLPEAIDKIKQHTRNYAKRQLTWFRADKEINWFEPQDLQGLLNFIESKL